MPATIDGPRIEAQTGNARQLVVILHGYGADGNDLIDIARQWQPFLPDAAFVAPHAHEPCAMAPMGRQWFALTDRNPRERWTGATSAHPVIDHFIDGELSRLGLDDSALVLAGFSQGAMMALHTGLRRKKAPAAILAYSGVLIGPEHLSEATASNERGERPPVFLIHGHQDEVVPAESLFFSSNALAEANIPCQWHLCIGLGHGIDGAGLRLGLGFISHSLGLGTPDFSQPPA